MDSIHSQLQAANVSVEDATLAALKRLQEHGSLDFGWPNSSGQILADYLVWRPRSPDSSGETRSTAIVSSRLGREVDRMDPIFYVLRTAISQLNPQRQHVISVTETTTHTFVARACELFGVPFVEVRLAKPKHSLGKWAEDCLTQLDQQTSSSAEQFCCVSPSITQESQTTTPLRDRIMVFGSHQLLVLHARANGNLYSLLQPRLQMDALAGRSSRVYLALGDDKLVGRPIAEELMDLGAIGWLPIRSTKNSPMPQGWSFQSTPAPILKDLENQDQYFIHCTRRRRGPWPQQPESEYLDELILGEPSRDRSSLAALSRIVRMRRLLASGESIRESTPVVSFTAAKLNDLSQMRIFRAHRGRWDFEPYGIGIERDWLISHGAREVTYGQESVWNKLATEDRPYFQRIGDQAGAIDWRIEKEWRTVGDIDLTLVPPKQAFVFVPTLAEAEQIALISPWPVVVSGANFN